ncbi:MAG: Flp pilus assembly complex ATPase component TadA [Gammaproteobacteria bacterium]|nr:Flp pilus assembly complex ATPase component TadA [Gammaproteobacteria bacterium]
MPLSVSVTPFAEDSTVIHLVNECIARAIKERVSDIHLEPFEHSYRIRYRVDGILEPFKHFPLALGARINARIKVMAELDIGERRLPQEGRITFSLSSRATQDLRISSCPTVYGEKIVIRILQATIPALGMEYLGLESKQKNTIEKAITRSQGLILVTGPTGSGKTVTLYSILSFLNHPEKNISSIEDPVEITLPGVNQVSVNSKIGLTFATALRAFLRQDPDVIMVGEIRDLETATMAFRAALTGHLVFSTLHTHTAREVLVRLSEMGVPPYVIANALTCVIAQRLVRVLCPECKEPLHLSASERELPFCDDPPKPFALYQAKGCAACLKGYKGRTGIFEVLPLSQPMTETLLKRGAHARARSPEFQKDSGFFLKQAGWKKVKEGITTIEEIERVL